MLEWENRLVKRRVGTLQGHLHIHVIRFQAVSRNRDMGRSKASHAHAERKKKCDNTGSRGTGQGVH